MKKRILSMMLAFLFVFALTAPASAIIEVYHEVSITNVPLPHEGSLYPGTAGISASHGTVKSIEWRKYNGTTANPWDQAEEGLCQFILTVGLEEGYDWDIDYTGIKVTSQDGQDISFMNYEVNGRDLSVTAWVNTAPPKGKMDYVEILPYKSEFAVIPGATPNFDGYLITNGGAGYSTRWWDGTTGKDLSKTDTFIEGHRYHISFYILPDPYAEWKEKAHGVADVEAVFITDGGTFKAELPSLSYESSGIKLVVTYTFDCTAPAPALKTISSVTIEAKNGFWYPVHGQKPADQESFRLLTDGCDRVSVSWYDETAGKYLVPGDTFAGGKTYTLYFNVFLSPGYAWDEADKLQAILEDGSGGGWTAKKPIVLAPTDYGTVAVLRFSFEAVKESLPEKLIVKNIHAPVAGKPLDFTAEVIGYSQFEVTWKDSEMDLGWYTADDKPVAEKGHIYSVSVRVWPPAGSEWPFKDTETSQGWLDYPFEMILSDGTKAEDAKAYYGGIDGVHPAASCVIGYTFPPVGQEKPDKPQVLFMEEPEDKTAAEGSTVSFKVVIKGDNKSIQWYEAKPGGAFLKLTDGADASSSTTTTLTLKNVKAYMNGYSYRCVLTDNFDLEVTSKAAVLTVTKASSEPASIVFKDVQESDWFYDWVYGAVKLGLINGKGKDKDGKDFFDPTGNITFAETVKLAACMHQLYTAGSVTLVNGDPWYRSYVDYCGENGILPTEVTGDGVITTGDILAKPNTAVSRAEFAWIFAHALPKAALPKINEIPDDSVPDVKHSGTAKEFWSFREQAYEEIYTLYRAGILNGSDAKGTFNPTSTIKRSEVAAIVVRMMEPAKRVGPPKELGQ